MRVLNNIGTMSGTTSGDRDGLFQPSVENNEETFATALESSNSADTATIASLSIAVCILAVVVILLICFVIYLYRWTRHTNQDHGSSIGNGFPEQMNNSQFQDTIQSLLNYQSMYRIGRGKINPVFSTSEVDRDRVFEEPQMEAREVSNDVPSMKAANSEESFSETDEILSPEHCSSGRLDRNLRELLKTDMKESVTVEVDRKLLVFMSRELDDTGGHLVLDKMGISLFVPPCAIPAGRKEIIYLVLVWDLSDFPSMTDIQTIISPVVHCGPHGMKLEKQAVLSFMHCAKDSNDIVVMTSQTNLMHHKKWRVMKKQTKCGSLQYSLLPNQCQVYLSHFSLYTCLAEGSETKKWLQLVAFGGRMKVGGHYQVYIHMLNNTPCALQFAVQQQAKHKCVQIRCPLEFLFDANRGDLIFTLDHLSSGWTSEGRKWEERGLVAEIWQGKCGNVSFVFNHENPAVTNLTFNIGVYQKGLADEKRCLQVAQFVPDTHVQTNQHPVSNVTNVNVNVVQDHGVAHGADDSVSPSLAPSEDVSMISGRGSYTFHDDVERLDNMDPDYEEDGSFTFERIDCCGGSASHDIDESVYNDYDNRNGDKISIVNETNQLDTPGTLISNRNEEASVRSDTGRQETPKRNLKDRSISKLNQGQNTTIQINIPPTRLDSNGNRDALLDPSKAPRPVFPHRLRTKLITLLDPANMFGNDWRIIASALGLDSLADYLRTKTSPTDVLLDRAVQNGKNLQWLADIMTDAQRLDAVMEIKKYIDNDVDNLGATDI